MSNPPVNPYRPPSAAVADMPVGGAATRYAAPAARVDAGRGASWIGEGWTLFKAAPVMWIVALILLFAIQFVLGLVPVLGSLASMLIGPFFMVGVLAFAQRLADGGDADLGQLFVGFKEKQGPLLAIAVLYFVAIVVIFAVCAGVAFGLLGGASLFSMEDPEQAIGALLAGAAGLSVLLLFLLAFALILLVAAAYWFAPGLVFYADLGAVEALKQSFAGVLRNWLPFLVYGIVSFVVMIAGTVALLIGLLVALPVLMASYHSSFKDLFGK